uniref:Uncharacterized protein n=1 Tax=Anguilla anguilla TaxID=7936 RepID=A0A0E9SUS8_ANGAN
MFSAQKTSRVERCSYFIHTSMAHCVEICSRSIINAHNMHATT